MFVDIVGDLAGVKLDVIRDGGELWRRVRRLVGGDGKRYIRRLGIQSHRPTLWARERGGINIW
jgi:hypothetical protein